jgi:hypothetical protein
VKTQKDLQVSCSIAIGEVRANMLFLQRLAKVHGQQSTKWLNDEIMDAYVALLRQDSPPGVVVMNCFFMTALVEGGYGKVKRWLKLKVPLDF